MKKKYKNIFVKYLKRFTVFKKINYIRLFYKSKSRVRACHMEEMFINSSGDVYPCCRTWNRPDMKIGHVDDNDLEYKILNFNAYCSCNSFKIRKAHSDEVINIEYLNLELSLNCQAKCAMCCVYAPDWKGTYNLYDSLEKVVDKYEPSYMLVQGGEILAQKQSVKWIEGLKNRRPELKISLVTNGSFGISIAKRVEKTYSTVSVSIVGFQPETYKKIMGLPIDKTKKFVEYLTNSDNVDLVTKYLLTPINIHETNLFLEWAFATKLDTIILSDSDVLQYMEMDTWDNYWEKILERTGTDIKTLIIKNKQYLEDNGTKIHIQNSLLELFEIDDNYLDKQELDKIVIKDYQRSDSLSFFGA